MNSRKKILIYIIPISAIILLLILSILGKSNENSAFGVNSSFAFAPISIPDDQDFSVITLEGTKISKNDFNGKILVLDFWSSWCVPCQKEGPILSEISKEWKKRNVEFIGISVWDSKENVENFIQENQIKYPNTIDENGQMTVDFGVKGIPEKIIINPDGKIIKRIIGPNTQISLEKILDDLTINLIINNE
ncbi:MAG: hypothetical protein CL780_05895 [Chloroflexi bacterium]|nr:hypothetical protein [Chloroflexota bacterium]|tara:strand:- start:1823 stop:2395 length:573 start_codon:yes stop_codon:yes gene_type:complete